MNFIFTVKTHGFVNAGVLEEALKKMSVQYTVEIEKAVAKHDRKKRTILTSGGVSHITKLCEKYPEETNEQIGLRAGVSRATVERVRNGKHALQQKRKGAA